MRYMLYYYYKVTCLNSVMHTTNLQRQQLIRLGVPSLFIAVSLDEGPGPPMRSPYTDLTKLYATVGILVRCCNVTPLQKSLHQVIISTALASSFSEKVMCVLRIRNHWPTHMLILS